MDFDEMTIENAISAAMMALESVGAGSAHGVTYLSVALKTGHREFSAMRSLGCNREALRSRHHDEWRRTVITPNVLEAQTYAKEARYQYPDSLVFDPTRLGVSGLVAENYQRLSTRLFEQLAKRVVATPGWALSSGARREIELAYSLRLPIVDIFGKDLSAIDLEDADRSSRAGLMKQGWASSEIDALLPELSLGKNRPVQSGADVQSDPPANDQVFRWLHNERQFQRRVYSDMDDNRSRIPFTDHSENSWWTRLHKYWDQAEIVTPSSAVGRELIAKFAAVAVGMLESIVRVYGPLPEPAISSTEDMTRLIPLAPTPMVISGDVLADAAANEVGATVFSWLQRERDEYVKPGTNPELDRRHIEQGLGRGGYWYRQLFNIYWARAVSLGPESIAGRQQFAKFASTSVSLLETSIKTFGPLPLRKLSE